MAEILGVPVTWGLAFKALSWFAILGVVNFFIKLYNARMLFRRAAKEHGGPMLPHSFLFGHLIETAKIVARRKLPSDFHGHWMFHFIQQDFPEITKEGVLYLDIWPINWPILCIFHPGIIPQITQETSLPKWWAQGGRAFKPFSGGEDLLHLEGQQWKSARAIFNPGFSAKNLIALVPAFVEETLVFQDRLRQAAKSGKTVQLEKLTTDVTVDVVARAVLGARLQKQTKPNVLMETMRKQLGMIILNLDLFKELSPVRPIKHWLYNRRIRNELMPHIQNTLEHLDDEGPKTVLALALKSYMKDHPNEKTIPTAFLEKVVTHIKVFMFAGHDTTASTLAYILYCLEKNPETLAKARAELDELLGTDVSQAGARISEDPTVLNRMSYIIACIKESLRLFPPVGGTARESPEGHFLVHPETGKRYPTHGFMLHSSVSTLHRDPQYWPQVDKFLPERWLVRDTNDPLYVGKNMWRPFEIGPRTCIGQELTNFELRLIVALTIRDFDFIEQYSENAPTLFGDKAYQSWDNDLTATAHCKDWLPVKVIQRKS
ncbi:cytochrome P450 [Xylariaceae sp. FL1651]|nr:cytochrome P450 [Xylariaceae sp. FL1651]